MPRTATTKDAHVYGIRYTTLHQPARRGVTKGSRAGQRASSVVTSDEADDTTRNHQSYTRIPLFSHFLLEQESRALTGRTARCLCKFR